MILEGPSIFDAFMLSAHATKRTSQPKALDTTTAIESKCQCCGSSFIPKRPMHIRCDKCQSDFTTKRKTVKKKKLNSKTKGKTKATKPFGSKANSTVFSSDIEDSDSSDNDSTNEEVTANYSSFFCSHATSAPLHDDPYVYFDNCSNLNIIRDRALALHLQRESVATKITGSIPGKFSATHSAELGDLGRCWNLSL